MRLPVPKTSTINTIYGVLGLLSASIGLAEHLHKYYAAQKANRKRKHATFGFDAASREEMRMRG